MLQSDIELYMFARKPNADAWPTLQNKIENETRMVSLSNLLVDPDLKKVTFNGNRIWHVPRSIFNGNPI